MVLRNNDLGSIFQDQEPQQAPDIKKGKIRDLTPNESDNIYRGLDRSDAEIEAIKREREEAKTPQPSLLSRVGAPFAWAMREYSRNISAPISELLTLKARTI